VGYCCVVDVINKYLHFCQVRKSNDRFSLHLSLHLDVTILISQNSGIFEQSFSGCFMAVWHGGVAVVMCCLWLC